MADPDDLDKLERSADDPYAGKYGGQFGGQYGSDDPSHYKKSYGSDESRRDDEASKPTDDLYVPGKPADIAKKETEGGDHPQRVGRGYTGTGPASGNKAKKFLGNKKKLLLLGGIPGLLFFGVILFFTLLFPTLKIQQLASHIEEYRLVRLTRTFYRQASIVTTEKIAVDAAGGSADPLTKATKTGVLLASLRPQAVINNMKATGILSFDMASGSLGATKVTAVRIKVNGQEQVIEAPKPQLGRPIANYKERLKFASQINSSVHDALRGNNYLVRSQASKLLLSGFGIRLQWWENKGAKYLGLSQDKADQLALQETTKKITTTPNDPAVKGSTKRSKVNGVNDAAQEANNAVTDCEAAPVCAKKIIDTGELPPEVTTKIDGIVSRLTGKTAFTGLLGFLNPIYAVGMPVCIVFDGSVQASDAFINSQNIAATKTFLAIASADSQQRKGDVTAQAVGAFNRRVGDIANSIPEKIARGESIDTSAEISPQAAKSGEFTVFNALFPSDAIAFVANSLADSLCPTITNTSFNTVLAVANVGAAFVIGPEEEGAGAAAKGFISQITSKIAQKFTTPVGRAALKNTARKYAVSSGKSGVATEGATYLARMLVFSEMGAFYNGTSSNDLANQADAGGVAYAQEMQRQQQFGRPLTTAEVKTAQVADNNYLAEQKSHQNTFERYFALSNPDSLASGLAMRAANFKLNNVASFFLNIPKVVGSIFLPLSQLLHPAVSAAPSSDINYNVVQWGWSPDEEALIDGDPSFALLENAQTLNAPSNYDKVYGGGGVAETYGKCFTADIGTLLTDGSVKRDADGNLLDEGDCSPTELGPHNPKYGDLVFRWRLDQSYQNTLNELIGVQDVSSSSSSGSTGDTSGYQNPLRDVQKNGSLVPERIDQGVDYGGSGPVYAIGRGTVLNLTNSGWPGGTFIVYRLSDGPAQGKYVFFAENCRLDQGLAINQSVDSNTKLCTMVDASPHIETGWADGSALGAAKAHNVWGSSVDDENHYTAYGLNFSQLLQKLGAPAGTIKPGAQMLGSLDQGWPTW